MTVYVDPARHPFGRMMMCHMWADTEAELFAMARRIGVAAAWVQGHPTSIGHGRTASWLHFDICKSKRALALKAGAIETDIYGPSEHTARLRGDQTMLDRIAEIRAQEAAP